MVEGTTMRTTAKALKLRSNVQALRIYPVESSTMTVGIVLDAENARALATRLLMMAEAGYEKIDVTAFRKPRKLDNTVPVTVTAV
jgi:hypothetical protein